MAKPKMPAISPLKAAKSGGGGESDYWGKTQIVLSFGTRGDGGLFATWLRSRLMIALGLAQANAIYIDSIGLQRYVQTYRSDSEIQNWTASTNPRDNARSHVQVNDPKTGTLKYKAMATLYDGWQDDYKRAMSEAHTMIFAATQEWLNSTNTQNELAWFKDLNTIRRNKPGARPLTGLVLRFEDAPASQTDQHFGVPGAPPTDISANNLFTIPVSKCPAQSGYGIGTNAAGNTAALAKVGGWVLTEHSIQSIVRFVQSRARRFGS